MMLQFAKFTELQNPNGNDGYDSVRIVRYENSFNSDFCKNVIKWAGSVGFSLDGAALPRSFELKLERLRLSEVKVFQINKNVTIEFDCKRINYTQFDKMVQLDSRKANQMKTIPESVLSVSETVNVLFDSVNTQMVSRSTRLS